MECSLRQKLVPYNMWAGSRGSCTRGLQNHHETETDLFGGARTRSVARMHATGSVSPRRARATAYGGPWTARRTPTGKFSLGAPSGLWEQLMHNGEAPPNPQEKAIVDHYREQVVLRSPNSDEPSSLTLHVTACTCVCVHL